LLATWTVFVLSGFISRPAFCRSQNAFAPKQNRITYGIENLSQGNIVLKTSAAFPISAPHIQYLSSQAGLSMMVADFDGLIWPYPARMIKLGTTQNNYANGSTIDFINLGQFQTSPPIFRITVAAHSPAPLKDLSFQAAVGSLTLNWASPQAIRPYQFEKHENSNAAVLESAPEDTDKKYAARQDSTRDFAYAQIKKSREPSGLTLAFTSESLTRDGDRQSTNPASIPLCRETPPLAPAMPIVPPTLSLTEAGPTKLEIKSQNKLSFKSFRLREPERFVVDFEDLPGLSLAELPPVNVNDFITHIRVGTAKSKGIEGRLVCDLTSDTTAVETKLSEDGNTLSLIFKKQSLKEAQSIPQGLNIILDAGHGGSDPGAQRGTMQEKDMTLPIVLFLKQKLEARGIKVLLTRNDDTFVSLEDRVRLTNSVSPDLFLSVHINSLDVDRDLHGIETYYQTPQSKTLAECIHESLVNHLDASDRAVRKARFYVINHTPVPAVLAEVGFISCKDEREKLISSDYQNRIARALEHGVMLYLTKQSESLSQGVAERKSLAQKEHESNNQSAD
jgi:N-acetylmuramoyl-L-alanine amidase